MADNDQHGPWGPSGRKNKAPQPEPPNPWMRKDRGPRDPMDEGFPPPDFDELWRRFRKWSRPFLPQDPKLLAILGASVVVFLWLLSGLYQVSSNQAGVVMRFGAYARTEMPGLRYHLPYPIETVLLPVVTSQNEIQIGFRNDIRRGEGMAVVPEESMMLTGDENVIDVHFTVFWRVSDVIKYLFEIRDPQITVKMAAESVMREVIGQNKLEFALTDGRSQIADEARARLQELLDEYNAGVVVTQINLQNVSVPEEVKAAFQDVINARLDQERFQNQAAAHVNKVIPDAKGQAAQILQKAMAYRDQKTAIARGEAERFKEVLAAYSSARDVTGKRLYLETMETVLGKSNKVIMDKGTGAAALPYLPLSQLMMRSATSAGASGEQP